MRTVNRVTIRGNVGADPTVNESNGRRIVKLSVATNGFNRQTGQQMPAQWHRITLFDPLPGQPGNAIATFAINQVRKGTRVEVEGRLHYSNYEDQDGNTRHGSEIIAHDLIVVSTPQQASNGQQPAQEPTQEPAQQQQTQTPKMRPETAAALKALALGDPGFYQMVAPDGSDLPF